MYSFIPMFLHSNSPTEYCKISEMKNVWLGAYILLSTLFTQSQRRQRTTFKHPKAATIKKPVRDIHNNHMHDCYLFYTILRFDFSFSCLANLQGF